MRHLSTPWFAENIPGGFVIRDAERKPVAYVYGHDRPWQSQGVPRPLTFDEARAMAMAIAKLAEVLMREAKAPQDSDQHSPPSAGKMAKRFRFDAAPSPHSVPAHSPIPVLNARPKAKRSDRGLTTKQIVV
jgi:hypothetical protein